VACSGIRRGDQQGLGIDFGLAALGGPTQKWIVCRLLVQRRKCREIGLSFFLRVAELIPRDAESLRFAHRDHGLRKQRE
jgi:hypothetical protein